MTNIGKRQQKFVVIILQTDLDGVARVMTTLVNLLNAMKKAFAEVEELKVGIDMADVRCDTIFIVKFRIIKMEYVILFFK